MKLKKMVVCITKKDIKNFLKLQDKINISDIFINDYLRLIGDVQVFGMNISIETELSFSKVEHNFLYDSLNTSTNLSLSLFSFFQYSNSSFCLLKILRLGPFKFIIRPR